MHCDQVDFFCLAIVGEGRFYYCCSVYDLKTINVGVFFPLLFFDSRWDKVRTQDFFVCFFLPLKIS